MAITYLGLGKDDADVKRCVAGQERVGIRDLEIHGANAPIADVGAGCGALLVKDAHLVIGVAVACGRRCGVVDFDVGEEGARWEDALRGFSLEQQTNFVRHVVLYLRGSRRCCSARLCRTTARWRC